MAGMLPGVECARRRKFHQSSGLLDSSVTSRRSSFCLHTGSHDYPLTSSSSKQRGVTSQVYQDEKLDDAAREAKQRLDERLRAKWKSENKRSQNNRQLNQRQQMVESKTILGVDNLQGEVFGGVKKSGSKKFNWAKKMIWKACEQDECAICLDQFKNGDNLMHLPCAHRFHSKCMLPWLESNAHCPCCRMSILTSTP